MHFCYKIPAMGRFRDEQVRFARRDRKASQTDKAEELLAAIDPDGHYLIDDLCTEIVGKPLKRYPGLSASGRDVRLDLLLLIEDLSASASISADNADERVWTIEELSRRFNVSQKTISRWRQEGLVSRRLGPWG